MIPTAALIVLSIVVVICVLTLGVAVWHTVTTRLDSSDAEVALTVNDKSPLTATNFVIADATDEDATRPPTPEPESPPPLAGEESIYALPPPKDKAESVNSPSTPVSRLKQLNHHSPQAKSPRLAHTHSERVPFMLSEPLRGNQNPHNTESLRPRHPPFTPSRPFKPVPTPAQREHNRRQTVPPRLTNYRNPPSQQHLQSRGHGSSGRRGGGGGGFPPRLAERPYQKPVKRDSMHDIIDLYSSEARNLPPMPHSAPPRTTTFAEAASKWAYFNRVEDTSMV